MKIGKLFDLIVAQFKKQKITVIIILTYLLLCLFSSIIMFCSNNIRNGFLAILFMSLVLLLILFSRILKIELPPLFISLILLFFFGGLAGTIYEMYYIIPFFDNILHGLSGFLFACLGYALMKHFVGEAKNCKNFVGCLLFGVCFSLAIAVFWEIYEYIATFFGFDMLEDTIITDFNSYLLAGSHSEIVSINEITKTIIYYAYGKSLIIDGYLDIGLLDTLHDMIICVIGTICFSFISVISYLKIPKINELLIPKVKYRM